MVPAGAPFHDRSVGGFDIEALLLPPALHLERDASEHHLLFEVPQVERPRLELGELGVGEVADLGRLVRRREVDERRRDLPVGAGELLRGQEDERLRVRVLGPVPDVGRDVTEVADPNVEADILDEFLASPFDVVLQRVAVGVITLGAAGSPRSEDVEVVDVEAELRPDDHALVGPGPLHVRLRGRNMDAARLAPLVQRERRTPEVDLLLHVERVELFGRELPKLLRQYAVGRHPSPPPRA